MKHPTRVHLQSFHNRRHRSLYVSAVLIALSVAAVVSVLTVSAVHTFDYVTTYEVK